MTNANNFADPREFLTLLPFVQEYGIEIVSAEPGRVDVSMPIETRFSTPPAIVPASIVGTIGDVAAVASCLSNVPKGWAVATLDFTIKMTGPARGDRLIARGRVLQNGRTNSVGTADVFCVASGVETHCGSLLATTRNFAIKA